jgi:PAS domain S-box-containing protein
LAPGRLLIIDDDLRHRASVARLVAGAGHEVAGEGSGADAADLLAEVPDADLVLLDLNMPEVDGYEVLSLVRGLALPPSVIVVTGDATDANMRRLLQLGANDFLVKPFAPDALLESIDDTLARRARDVATSRLLARVRESDQLYRFLVEQSPDVIYTLDAQGHFTFVSASAEQVFGQGPDTLLGAHWSTLFAPGERDRARHRFDERRTGDRATRNLELRLAQGELGRRRWVQVSATGLYGGGSDSFDGTTTYEGTYGIVRDVSAARTQEDQRGRLEAQLEQARRMEAIGQLAGGIAHDFNNILASMIGYAELAQMSIDGIDDPSTGYLEEVVSAGHRARDLIAQLLNFSRAEEGNPRPVRVGREVDDVARMLRAVIPSSVRIETHTDDSDATVSIDPVQLQQILLNLFINARDAVESDGVIRVRVSDQRDVAPRHCAACGEPFSGDFAVLEVADNGSGIAPELQRHLFDPMVTARPGKRGTGFGLTLIKNIVHRNGGHLLLDSARGEGTAFRIYLPGSDAGASPDTAGAEAAADALPVTAAHIVIVDDEASVANFLRELLDHAGHRTTVFNDPETALGWLAEHVDEVDLVITDQTMPRVTGVQLAARLVDRRGDLPVILCTGYGHEAANAERGAVAAVLAKPFEIRELLAAVERHLIRD